MTGSIRFVGSCPTCGRKLHVPIELYGKRVRCHACNAEFCATSASPHLPHINPQDFQSLGNPPVHSPNGTLPHAFQRESLDSRVDTLLAQADKQLQQACLPVPQNR
ncbi:MAG: hypothetical protein ACK52S_20355 [Pirellula sp.]